MVSSNPGDIRIGATVTAGGQTYYIHNQLRELSVFEDLKKPYVTVQALFADNGDLLNNIPIRTQGVLALAFSQVPDQSPYSGIYILSTVKVHRASEQLRTTSWSMQAYSPHMFVLPLVQKSYQEVLMSDVTADLVNNFLPGRYKGLTVRAPSRNLAGNINAPYVVNNQQVFRAIRDSMLASASAVDTSSVYLLFENLNGLYLDTMEHLLQSPLGISPTYTQNLLGTNFMADVVTQQFSIINYSEDDRLDTTALIQAGAQDVATYDMFNQNFNAATSALSSLLSGFGGKSSAVSGIPYNSLRPPTFRQNTAAPRRLMAALADSQSVTVQVPLNPQLVVGNWINFNIVGALGDVQQSPHMDWHSGTSLISETHHNLVLSMGKMQGTTTCRCIPRSCLDYYSG